MTLSAVRFGVSRLIRSDPLVNFCGAHRIQIGAASERPTCKHGWYNRRRKEAHQDVYGLRQKYLGWKPMAPRRKMDNTQLVTEGKEGNEELLGFSFPPLTSVTDPMLGCSSVRDRGSGATWLFAQRRQ